MIAPGETVKWETVNGPREGVVESAWGDGFYIVKLKNGKHILLWKDETEYAKV